MTIFRSDELISRVSAARLNKARHEVCVGFFVGRNRLSSECMQMNTGLGVLNCFIQTYAFQDG